MKKIGYAEIMKRVKEANKEGKFLSLVKKETCEKSLKRLIEDGYIKADETQSTYVNIHTYHFFNSSFELGEKAYFDRKVRV